MNWRFGVAILVGVLLGSLLRAAEPDEQFVRIFALIQEADGLAEGGHKDLAAQKYREAQGSLIAFRKAHPGWNESVVDYRLKYIEEKLNVPANQPAISPADKTSDSPGGRGDSADLFRRLEEQIRQLKADKELLQDKLKEALIAQPAAVDPRELSKAEEKINALRKEIDVLRVNLQKAESKPDRPVDPVVLEETRKALAMAQRKVAEQTERAATLTLEKEALEKQLKASIDGVETKPKRVEDDAQGRREHDLETKVGKGTRALERDLSEAKAVGRTNALSVSALQSSLKGAQRENAEARTQIKGLERERDELQRKLGVAIRESQDTSARARIARTEQLTDQIVVLRARLDALESRKSPYSSEELALLKPPELSLAKVGPGSDPKPPASTPAPAESLTAKANRAFSDHQYTEAETNLLQALRLDGKNGGVLANLAVVEIEQDRLAEAENHLNEALAADSRDAFSLSLLGALKFRQQKYEDAFDALSQATRIDPQNVSTLQYLGIVLANKGLREPAESAFRRVIALAPDNAAAHQSLAVIYATRRPPALELARWHYRKAVEAGHPKDEGLEKILRMNNR